LLRSGVPADLDCGDVLPTEIGSFCDWQNHVIKLGCRYKDMPTFHLVVRQFAINNEFELGIESTLVLLHLLLQDKKKVVRKLTTRKRTEFKFCSCNLCYVVFL
jgi:hypothetical protein